MVHETIDGIEIVQDPNMLELGPEIEVRRTWKERLFTLPWTPLKRTKLVMPMVPMKSALSLLGGRLAMHPEVYAEFKRQVAQAGGTMNTHKGDHS